MFINVIIPLAGKGSRFKKNFHEPKPLIKINKKTLIEIAIETLNLKRANFFFVTKKYNNKKYNDELLNILFKYTKKNRIIQLKKDTSGSVSSCLKIKKINKNLPLIIANCDQYLNWQPKLFFKFVKRNKADGAVLTYKSRDKKNSFVVIKKGKIVGVAEKKVISNNALIGIHYWRKTQYFFETGRQLVKDIKQTQKKRESFVSETYKYMLIKKKIILPFSLKKKEFFLIGTPSDYNKFYKFIKNNDKSYFI